MWHAPLRCCREPGTQQETILTPANVNSTTFLARWRIFVDGRLTANSLSAPGDDSRSGQQECALLRDGKRQCVRRGCGRISGTSATVPLEDLRTHPAGETPLTTADTGCGYINPVGIMSTPVMNRSRNAIYRGCRRRGQRGSYSITDCMGWIWTNATNSRRAYGDHRDISWYRRQQQWNDSDVSRQQTATKGCVAREQRHDLYGVVRI